MHMLPMLYTYIHICEYVRGTHYFIFSHTSQILHVFAFKNRQAYWNSQIMSGVVFLNWSNICVKTCKGAKYASVAVTVGSHCVGIRRNKLSVNL